MQPRCSPDIALLPREVAQSPPPLDHGWKRAFYMEEGTLHRRGEPPTRDRQPRHCPLPPPLYSLAPPLTSPAQSSSAQCGISCRSRRTSPPCGSRRARTTDLYAMRKKSLAGVFGISSYAAAFQWAMKGRPHLSRGSARSSF